MATWLMTDGEKVNIGLPWKAAEYGKVWLDRSGDNMMFSAPASHGYSFEVNDSEVFSISSAGAVVSAGLTVTTSTDSAAVADAVSIGRYEIGAGNTVLALSQETVVATETDETKFSHKVQMRINGATYFVMLTAT